MKVHFLFFCMIPRDQSTHPWSSTAQHYNFPDDPRKPQETHGGEVSFRRQNDPLPTHVPRLLA